MLQSFLNEAQSEFLRQEMRALATIRLELARLDIPHDALETLQQAILQLDELFLLVVVGEFNAGKSALMNALLGTRILPEGVTPTTSRVTLVKWGDEISNRVVDENFCIYTHPLPLLRQLNIVDTPGTNAVIRHHERLTQEYVPRSDLVLFVTSAERPITESERLFLEQIRDWGKKVVLVLNKADILEDATSLQEVRDFVLKHTEEVLGVKPEFFPVSARLAQRSQSEVDPTKRQELRAASHIDALINYVNSSLDDQARLRLKLTSPLGVAEHFVEQQQSDLGEQAQALDEDIETVTALEGLIAGYEQDLSNELSPRLAQVDNILHRMQERGIDFFDSTLRLTNLPTLARGDLVRAQFEKRVLADVPQQIEDRINRLIDWLVEKDLRQWQQITGFLQRRQANMPEQLGSQALVPLDTRRRALIDSVGKTSETIVQTYNRDQEARELAMSVESAVAQVALIEAGAVGLGTLVLTVLASSAADITGMLAAGTLAILGFFVIPYKRQQAQSRFREKVAALRTKLMDSLTTQFQNETETMLARIKEGVTPYTRFVRAERERIRAAQTALAGIRHNISELKAKAVTL